MNCKNCHTELEQNDDYCKSCGGKVIRNRLTLKNLFEHLSETFFNYDNKLLRTIIDLLKTPESVIDGYVEGIRKRYVNPISFFGLSLTITGLSIVIIKKFYAQYLDFSRLFEGVNLPQSPVSTNSTDYLEYNSLFYFVIVPLFALLSWIVFINKKYNYTEHVIIYLYTMALLGLFSAIVGQIVLFTIPENYFLFGLLFYPIMFIYTSYALKRIFGLSFGQLLIKALFFFVLFFATYIIVTIIVGIIMFFNGSFDEMIETKKAAIEAKRALKDSIN
jgi:hypothetical protein